MAVWDEESGKLRPTWKVRFKTSQNFLGCALAGVIAGIVLIITTLIEPAQSSGETEGVGASALMLLGLTFGVFIVIGPTLAWGLGFALRTNENSGLHLLAFAVLGLIPGFMIGGLFGMGQAFAPAYGLGAAAGRWLIGVIANR